MFAYPAGITERLRFTTGFLTLPQRQTPLVALQAADVDLLSGHNIGLDVGIDWNYVEYQARLSGGTSVPAAPGRGNRSSSSAGCSPNPSATSPAATTGPTERTRTQTGTPTRSGPAGSGETAFDRAARLARTTRTACAGHDVRQLLGSRSWVVRLRWKNWRLFTPARVRGFVCKNVRRMSTTIRIYPDLTVVA